MEISVVGDVQGTLMISPFRAKSVAAAPFASKGRAATSVFSQTYTLSTL